MGHFDADIYFSIDTKTRVCLICGKLEDPGAKFADGGDAWLCDDCRMKLRKLLGVDSDG